MNVQQILDETSLLIHHDLTTEQQVNKLNQLSRQLFREFELPDKIYKFQMYEPSKGYYALPVDCAEDRIRTVIVDGVEYPKVTPEIQQVYGFFCMVIAEKLFLYPNKPDKHVFLYYRPRHIDIKVGELYEKPSFPEDYHELLVYGLARYIASIQRDVDMANNFQYEYDEIFKKAQKGLKKMGLKRVKESTKW